MRLLNGFLSEARASLQNDPDEQQKRLRYNDLVASAVILHNVVDMSLILTQFRRFYFLNPHLTSSVKRFGDYTLNMTKPPEPNATSG